MARIRMLTSVAGVDFEWHAGQEIDLPGTEAAKWADGVRAELVRTASVETPERATATETSARKPPRRRKPPAPPGP
ncbi:hypothetical protein ACIRPU_12575 [Streptomyces sp. NPDC102259]|uniref:hypothetical protein n=1 Tax=Streptomyces sp. NPDC102259 TaxID=3366148 RepID=UPI0038223703